MEMNRSTSTNDVLQAPSYNQEGIYDAYKKWFAIDPTIPWVNPKKSKPYSYTTDTGVPIVMASESDIITDMDKVGYTIEKVTEINRYVHLHPGAQQYITKICQVLNLKYTDSTKIITFDDDPEEEGVMIIIRLKEYPIDIFRQLENSVEKYNNIYPPNSKILVTTDFLPA